MSNNKDIPLARIYALINNHPSGDFEAVQATEDTVVFKNNSRKMFINISLDGVQFVSVYAKPGKELYPILEYELELVVDILNLLEEAGCE